MTEPLTLDRFRDLADAYGGVIAHWPEAERDAAQLLAQDPEAAVLLTQASTLDRIMDTWKVPVPSGDLAARIAAAAPLPMRHFVRRARLWWSGIGIATALAGAAAGAATVVLAAPVEAGTGGTTSFGDVSASES